MKKNKLAATIIFVVFGILVGRQCANSAKLRIENFSEADLEYLTWTTNQVANTGLYFSSPFLTSPLDVPIKESNMQYLEEIGTYQIYFPNKIENSFGYALLKEGNKFNLENALYGGIDEALQNLKSIEKPQRTSRSTYFEISGFPARIAEVSFTMKGVQKSGVFLFIGKGERFVWNFTFLMNKDDMYSKKIVERIISSIEIQNKKD